MLKTLVRVMLSQIDTIWLKNILLFTCNIVKIRMDIMLSILVFFETY